MGASEEPEKVHCLAFRRSFHGRHCCTSYALIRPLVNQFSAAAAASVVVVVVIARCL
jgi:hypothetical protein